MKKKVLALLTILFFVILTSAAFAQSSAPSDQQTRPGPGYGSSAGPGGGYGYGPGYGMGPGMMGPGYGYAPGEGQYYPNRHYNMMGGGWGDIHVYLYVDIFGAWDRRNCASRALFITALDIEAVSRCVGGT